MHYKQIMMKVKHSLCVVVDGLVEYRCSLSQGKFVLRPKRSCSKFWWS